MTTIAVVGLGYVGLPLALKFGVHYETIGFDVSTEKVEAYRNHHDPANEVEASDFEEAVHFSATTDPSSISSADFIIVAMPTPVDGRNVPDFKYLELASATVGKFMKPNAIVIYESTVYPGATEEICVPILERYSGLEWKKDFNVAYSPERISPGDKVMPLVKLKKIVSGDTEESLKKVSELYKKIIIAGVYEAKSIQVAEAAKVVENIQRDVNIALMNELATIFPSLGLDTNDVLDAAASKWNFVNYRPGLVGGHCIGVDPYYLIHRAKEFGLHTPFMECARSTNNNMVEFVADRVSKSFDSSQSENRNIAVVGLTFKEGCKDIRNSKVFDLIYSLEAEGFDVYPVDPIADAEEVEEEYGVKVFALEEIPECGILVLASPHAEIVASIESFTSKLASDGTFVDVKGRVPVDRISCFNVVRI